MATPLLLNGKHREPESYHLADWRRRINDLYADLRERRDGERPHAPWLPPRAQMFAHHPMTPVTPEKRHAFSGISAFSKDQNLQFHAGLKQTELDALSAPIGAEGELSNSRIARTDGLQQALGAELNVFWVDGYGGVLFIPFHDASNSAETYDGGRYLVDAIKDSELRLAEDGWLIPDFNFRYTPYSALNPAFVCPLSPPESRFSGAIRADEKLLPE